MSTLRHANPFVDPAAAAALIAAFEDFPRALALTDAAGRFLRVNTAASALIGHAERELIGRCVTEILTLESRERLAAIFAGESAHQGAIEEHEWALLRPDLTIVRARVFSLWLKDPHHRACMCLRMFESLTADRGATESQATGPSELRLAEVAQRRSQAMIDAATAALPVAFTTFDTNLNFTSVVGGLGRPETRPQDFVGRHVSEVTQDPVTLAALSKALEGTRSTTRTLFRGLTYLNIHAPIRDETANIVGVVSVSADVTAEVTAEAARRRAGELALFQASHDPLTGLAARSALVEHLGSLSRSEQGAGLLLLLDLDDFTLINDSLGHEVGDAVLLEVASRITEAFPGSMVARHGGDEFGVVAPTVTDVETALELGERVHSALAAEVRVGRQTLRVSASVGLALQAGGPSSTVIGNAHSALSQAKEAGSGQTRLYDAEMRRQVQERLRIQDGLRVALGAGELHVNYQPIVALATRRIVGAEALLRWTHPQWGHVPPATFIPIAERTGLIVPIGKWVMQTACNDMLSPQREHGLYVSVNVSARQFIGRNFADWVEEMLGGPGLPPSALVVEVTESALMGDVAELRAAFDRLRCRGVRVAVDDFGTGYSSLARLQVLPVDVIKLDRAFVGDIDVRPEARGMAAAILQMSVAIGAAIVAEGVETENEARTLVDLGYEMAQGYLLSRPMPIDELSTQVRLEAKA